MSKNLSCNASDYENSRSIGLFDRPRVKGDFSTGKNMIQRGDGNLRRFDEEMLRNNYLSLDLTHGYYNFEHKNFDDTRENIQKYFLMTYPHESCLKRAIQADFVTSRGLLTRVAQMPYHDLSPYKEENKIACCIHGDVIFMDEFDSHAYGDWARLDDRGKLLTYSGYKFEQYVTKEKNQPHPITNVPVSTWNKYYVFNEKKFGFPGIASELKVLYTGEIDCIDSKNKYLELKTQYLNLKTDRNYDLKMMRWWLQSYLSSGVERIVVGIRQQNNTVNRIEEIQVNQMPNEAQKWKPVVCMEFLHTFLATVKDLLKNQPNNVILLAEKTSGMKYVKFTLLTSPYVCQQYKMLTDDFKKHFNKMA